MKNSRIFKIIFLEFLVTALLYFCLTYFGSLIEKNNPYLQSSFADFFKYFFIIIWFFASFTIINILKILSWLIIKKIKKTISKRIIRVLNIMIYIILMFLPLIEMFDLNIYRKDKKNEIILNQQNKPVMKFSDFINRSNFFTDAKEKDISEASNIDSIEYKKYLYQSGYLDSVFYSQEIYNIFDKRDKIEFLINSENKILEKTYCNGKVKMFNSNYHNLEGDNLTFKEFNNLRFSYLLRPNIPENSFNISFSYYKLDIPSELSQSLSYEVPIDTKIIITNEITKIDTFQTKKIVHWLYENL